MFLLQALFGRQFLLGWQNVQEPDPFSCWGFLLVLMGVGVESYICVCILQSEGHVHVCISIELKFWQLFQLLETSCNLCLVWDKMISIKTLGSLGISMSEIICILLIISPPKEFTTRPAPSYMYDINVHSHFLSSCIYHFPLRLLSSFRFGSN